MDLDNRRAAWLPWASVGLLAALCGVLALLQYRWIGEIRGAERQNLRAALRNRLDDLRRDLNQQLAAAERALQPAAYQVDELGREAAYSAHYLGWRQTHEHLFRRIALATPQHESLTLSVLDLKSGQFSLAAWPQEWSAMQSRLAQRARGEPVGPPLAIADPFLLEVPRFAGAPGVGREQEWLILELDVDYARSRLLPDLIARYLGVEGKLEYDAQVVVNRDHSVIIYQSPGGSTVGPGADASVTLLDTGFPGSPRGFAGSFLRKAPPRLLFGPPSGAGFGEPGRSPQPQRTASGLWLLRVRHQAGSLESLVAQARRRNLAISGGALLLILTTVILLVRLTRRTQQLAQLQINFVAGVSHELRTPLAVIRTAAFNLRGKLAHRPNQVERYGDLIQAESEKLGGLVEQILRFASAKAGHIIRRREAVSLETVIDQSLASSLAAFEESKVILEKRIEPGLPLVFADETALQRAIQNLVDNAVKHGGGKVPWVGIFASTVSDARGKAVEISVEDRGPGIPVAEQKHIFEAFFRGSRALAAQVHGAGLGLDLVKRIVEAHGGTVRVQSEPDRGATFIVRLPALAVERREELAPSLG